MSALSLDDLVRNRTMSASIAATLTAAVRERRSFCVFAVPRLAGKSTVLEAMLARRARGVPIRTVDGSTAEAAELRRTTRGGYLVIPEIANSGVPGYIWGAPVRRVFETLAAGYALATALHAGGIAQAFAIISGENAVPDEDASRLQLAVYIRSLGEWQAPTARRVAEVHEIEGVSRGEPRAHLLHRWDERSDEFVDVDAPRIVGRAAQA